MLSTICFSTTVRSVLMCTRSSDQQPMMCQRSLQVLVGAAQLAATLQGLGVQRMRTEQLFSATRARQLVDRLLELAVCDGGFAQR